MTFAWYDVAGLIGSALVLLAFFLLQAGRLPGNGLAYQLLNLVGAAGVLLSLLGAFNPAVLVLEGAWVLVSAYGIVRSLRTGRAR